MNIFITDKNPIKAAENLCDKHVNKMLLESTQLLCTYLNIKNISTPYKSTHQNHPCQLWLHKSSDNVYWLYKHFTTLLMEYHFRYNKKQMHKCGELLSLFRTHFARCNKCNKEFINNLDNINFTQCMPDEFKNKNTIKAYRNYYIYKYNNFKQPMKWTNAYKPKWIK